MTDQAPVVLKKSRRRTDTLTCIVHYKRRNTDNADVRALTETGFRTIHRSMRIRQASSLASSRLDEICRNIPTQFNRAIHGTHRWCSKNFTNVGYLERNLAKQQSSCDTMIMESPSDEIEQSTSVGIVESTYDASTSQSTPVQTSARKQTGAGVCNRAANVLFSATECLFCGRHRRWKNTTEGLVKCTSVDAENSIRECAVLRKDFILLGKIEGIDLRADQAMYHESCRRQYLESDHGSQKDVTVPTKGVYAVSARNDERHAHSHAFQFLAAYVRDHIIDRGGVERMTTLREKYLEYIQQHSPHVYNPTYPTQKVKDKLCAHFGNEIKLWRRNLGSEFVYSSLLETGIELRVKEAISRESCQKPTVSCDHRPKRDTKDSKDVAGLSNSDHKHSGNKVFSFRKASAGRRGFNLKTGIYRSKRTSGSKAKRALKKMLETGSTDMDSGSAYQQPYPRNMHFNKHLESMAATLLQYRSDRFLCDALVMVDDGELQAHSVILSAVSRVFKSAFTMPNVSHCVRVSNVSMDVMKLALDAIYTGRIDCDDINRFEVIQLLLRLQVDICNFEETEKTKMKADIIHVKRDIEEYIPCDDEPTIRFSSVNALDGEMNNVTEEPVPETVLKMISQSVEEISHVDDNDDSEQDPMDSNRENDLGHEGMLDYQCDAVESEQIKKLQEQYLSLCDRKQSLMLASLVELNNLTQPMQANTRESDKGIRIVKYFLPLDEAGQRVRVCQKTFRQAFSIGESKLYEQVFSGNELIYGGGIALESSTVDDNRLNIKQEEGDDMPSLTVLLSADCQCHQCRGKYQCPHCDFKSSSQRSRRIHVAKFCRNAQSHAATSGYSCDYCSVTCADLREINEHILSEHGRSSEDHSHICDICNKSFNKRYNLKQHREQHHNDGLYLCQVCGKNCNSRLNLLVHVAKHSRENIVREFRCNMCPMKFKRQLMCIKHKEKVHGVIEPRVSVFCDMCGKCFGRRNTLRYHQRLFCRYRNKTD